MLMPLNAQHTQTPNVWQCITGFFIAPKHTTVPTAIGNIEWSNLPNITVWIEQMPTSAIAKGDTFSFFLFL
jgi:hypothetical protein